MNGYYGAWNHKKEIKRYNAFLSSMVGMVIGIIAQYIVSAFVKFLNDKSLSEIVSAGDSATDYYSAVISGAINGVLLVCLPPKLFPFAAVIVITTIHEVVEEIMGEGAFVTSEFAYELISDIFLILFVNDLINKVTKKNVESNSASIDYTKEKFAFSELFTITLVSSLVVNISFATSREGLDAIMGVSRNCGRKPVIPMDTIIAF